MSAARAGVRVMLRCSVPCGLPRACECLGRRPCQGPGSGPLKFLRACFALLFGLQQAFKASAVKSIAEVGCIHACQYVRKCFLPPSDTRHSLPSWGFAAMYRSVSTTHAGVH